MARSSAVEILAVKEAEYGKTPVLNAAATGHIVRYVSESLSGTPQTQQSQELRRDRMSGGQVITGLESGGDINFELSKEPLYDEFMSGAMMRAWMQGHALTPGAAVLTKNPTNDQLATLTITGDTGDFDGAGRGLQVGDVLMLSGFVNASNNGPVQVTAVVDATNVEVVVPRAAVDETAADDVVVHLPDYLDIGEDIFSWTLSKSYTDVLHQSTSDEHSQRYPGSIVNAMSIAIAYGEIVTGTFSFLSNGYQQEFPSLRQKLEAGGGTVHPAGEAMPLNGSVDLPTVTIDGQPTDFCIQSLTLSLNNGSTPQNCIGHIAPKRYNLGTATIEINTSIYLGDQSYDRFMPAKLNMMPISMLFAAMNGDGGYAFDLRAVQLSFPDPAASGGEQPVLIEAAGTAKVGPGGSSALRIWRF